MKLTKNYFGINLLIVLTVFSLFSCSQDTDLLLTNILEEKEEITDPVDPEEDPETEDPVDEAPNEPKDTTNPNKIVGTYYPTSAAEISNSANVNMKAIITNSFDCSSCVFAANQTIEPAGGVITGTKIGLNGAYIEYTTKQAFSPAATFSTVYEASRLSPETFGAVSGDAIDDNDAIDALINNAALATATTNGTYIKNKPSRYTRSGTLDWDLNGAAIKITSTSNFDMSKPSTDAVFDITNLSPTIYNGEFDGTGTYGRLFYLHGQNHFAFRNLHVHDLYSPNAIRCVAFRFTINADGSGFTGGEFKDNLIENVVAQGDGNFNDTFGIAKAFWWTLSGMSTSTNFNVLYQNNVVRNIIGDDAEGFYAIGGARTNHNGSFTFDNEDYRYCTRRAIKACVSNVEIKNSYFEEIPESMFKSAQQMGSMVDFFSTSSGYNVKNIRVHNNTLRSVPGNNSHSYLLSMTEVEDAIIEDNTLILENIGTYGGIRLGSNTSTYNGDLKDVVIRNNTLNNTYIQAMQYYNPNNALVVDNNTFNWTSTLGYQIGAFRFYGSGTKGNVNFTDNTININMDSANGINGAISADPAVTGIVNFKIDNAKVTYTKAVSARPFAYMQCNFDSSNSISNSTLVGASGGNSIEVSGVQSVSVVNSKDASGNPLTVK